MKENQNKTDQEKVWNNIAVPWKKYRFTPAKEVIEFLKNKKGKLLDLSCGSGRNFPNSKKIEIYALDFSKNMLKYAEEYAKENKMNTKFFHSETTHLPFENNFFDIAIFIASLHCIEGEKEREKTLEELYRVLKPKAQAIISVWSRDQKRVKNKPKESYIPWTIEGKKYLRYTYLYDNEELNKVLKLAGFKIIKSFEEDTSKGQYSKKNIILIVEKP